MLDFCEFLFDLLSFVRNCIGIFILMRSSVGMILLMEKENKSVSGILSFGTNSHQIRLVDIQWNGIDIDNYHH